MVKVPANKGADQRQSHMCKQPCWLVPIFATRSSTDHNGGCHIGLVLPFALSCAELVGGPSSCVYCPVRKGAGGSQSIVSVCQQSLTVARHLYRVAVELGKAAQLCVFILGRQYLYLGVLSNVFGYGCAVFVLVSVCQQQQ